MMTKPAAQDLEGFDAALVACGRRAVVLQPRRLTSSPVLAGALQPEQHHDRGLAHRRDGGPTPGAPLNNTGQAKVDEVHAYLDQFFPGQVSRFVAQGEAGYAFRVPDDAGGIRHEVHVSDAFLGCHAADEIQRVLSELQLVDELRQAGTALVHVDADGIHVARRSGAA